VSDGLLEAYSIRGEGVVAEKRLREAGIGETDL
jgi:hypothetical protein